jgi:hypothetical protein
MADLITDARAKYNINQSSFTAAETTTIDALITAISKLIQKYCKRNFTSTTYDELYDGSGDDKLVLKHYPLVTVSRVAFGPVSVLTITNTSSTNQRATVQLATSVTEDGAAIIRTSTGLSLTRVASGVSSIDTSVTWAGNPTLQAVATAVNALGNGWSATVAGGYELAASSDLRALQGSLTCRNLPQGAINAELVMHSNELSWFDVDYERGWIRRSRGLLTPWDVFVGDLPTFTAIPAYWRVIYTAGYASVPEDVQEACAQWVSSVYWQTKENPAVYPHHMPSGVALMLDHYRAHPGLGRVGF